MPDAFHTFESCSTFGQCRIVRLLGCGRMGEVEHELIGKRHALKLLSSVVMTRLEHRRYRAGGPVGRGLGAALRMELMPGRDASNRSMITLEDYMDAKTFNFHMWMR